VTSVPLEAVAEDFRRDGHCVVRALASAEEVAAIRPAIEAAAARRTAGVAPLEERDTYGKAFLQAMNLWRLDEAIASFVFDPRFARTAATLTGPPFLCRWSSGLRRTPGVHRSIACDAGDPIATMSSARTGGPGRADWQ
jgi:hypothetical protein